MGLRFCWFKNYEILNTNCQDFCSYDEYSINLIDGDSTSHSYGNSALARCLFEKIIGQPFPKLPNEDFIDSEDCKLNLIEPKDMSTYCEKVLNGTDVDNFDLRNRFEWFKKLSDEGYYIAYDWL